MTRPPQHRLDEARRYVLNMAQGRANEVTVTDWAAHLAGSANVWICPSCLRSTPGSVKTTGLTCQCGAVLAP